jgi:hypothetical protein
VCFTTETRTCHGGRTLTTEQALETAPRKLRIIHAWRGCAVQLMRNLTSGVATEISENFGDKPPACQVVGVGTVTFGGQWALPEALKGRPPAVVFVT